MGDIVFPAKPKLTKFDLDIVVPNVTIFSSIYTGRQQAHARSNMRWEGSIGWPRLNIADRSDDIETIEVFLLS